jgi:PadR family transcriptional regulator, regulatory protein PadR
MPPRTGLGELELLVLLALARLPEGGYGVLIRQEIRRRTGRSITPGAIYPTLDRLERKGLVRSFISDPELIPGGRAKRHFTLRPSGLREARRAWTQYATLVRGISAFEPGSSA